MKEDEAEFFSSLYETATEEVENLKLTLERNELREQVLKQELTEMESVIDKQNAELFEMERQGDRPRY